MIKSTVSEWLGTIVALGVLFMALKWTANPRDNYPGWVGITIFIFLIIFGIKLIGMVLRAVFAG